VGAYRAGKIPPDFEDSPFNAAVDLQPHDLYFTLEETKELFKMAERDYRFVLPEEVLLHIQDVTAGLVLLTLQIYIYIPSNLLM